MVLFLDIDGTILNSNQNIGSEDLKLITQIKDTNRIILISARKPSATRYIARQLNIKKDVIICYNGALLLLGKKVLSEHIISYEIIKDICAIANNYGASANIYCEDRWLTTNQDEYVKREAEIIGESPQVVLEIPKDISARKILIMCDDQQTESIMYSLCSIVGINLNKSKKGYIEITDNRASKEHAYDQVLRYWDISVSETMAIGDGSNDMLLLKKAAIGIAMQNADDEVKKVANFITLSNENNGVAFAIKHYMEYFRNNKF